MDLNELNPKMTADSAVLVMHELTTDSLILTKRTSDLRIHPGEVCFPGGRREAQDLNLYETALRETYEELAIAADRITLINELQIETTLLGSVIHPWLVSIDTINPYVLNPQEVAEVLAIPMALVRDVQNYREILVERQGFQFTSWEFVAHQEHIWGATVRIMKQLISLPTT